jgi:capsular polysaccharide export protein
MLKKVYLFCDSVERYFFFERLYSTDKNRELIFVTNQPLVRLICGVKRQKVTYLGLSVDKTVPCKYCIPDSENTLEYILGNVSDQQNKELLNSYITELHKKISSRKSDTHIFVVWNGHSIIANAAKYYASIKKIDCLFLEISNLPNKIFVDSEGVNAYSKLYKNPEILDGYHEVEKLEHESWLCEYEIYKSGKIPQAKTTKLDLLLRSINKLLNIVLYSTVLKKQPTFKSLLSRPTPINIDFQDTTVPNLDEKFIFCPLQVSTDTQILLNSDINNEGILRAASKAAKLENNKLFVKIHPAERCRTEVDRIIKLKYELDFELVTVDTLQLIKRSEQVFVNNSTVGLEALIYNKKVTVLGRALFSKFDQTRLKKYIHSYLIDGIDYFGKKKINVETILRSL